MGIYRGPGGSGDAVNDAASEALITVQAKDAALAAQAAAEAAQAAAQLAETNAETAETNAETAETNAETAATNAANSASAASTSASNASSSASAASTSASNASTSASNAASSASAASTSASNAATSASTATTQATNASNSASAAATSATNASNSASAAATSATNAANSATAAQTARTAAELAETNAETAETNAETAEANAAASASAAASSASSASSSASSASSSASAASTSASNAAASATSASNSASTATTQATNASNSASAAATSETNAASSASAASTSATNAASSATSAAGSASTATTQATNASNSASAAATSATNAANSASAAATSETNASNSASAAATSATNASNSASAASTSATNASNSATSAANSATAAAASYDSFDDRYLGAKASAPTLDNDGNTLLVGALYYDTTSSAMKVWSGSAWLDAYASLSGALLATNNLSDLNNTATARTNLGVAIGTDVQAYDADTAKLDVAQSWSAAQSFNAGVTLGDASGDALTINSSAVSIPNGLNFDSNTFVIDAANNRVGVGTASPAQALDVVGSIRASSLTSGRVTYAGTSGLLQDSAGLTFNGTDTLNIANIVSTGKFGLYSESSGVAFGAIGTTNYLRLLVNNAEQMRITSTGNVGIGTSSPDAKLDISGGGLTSSSIALTNDDNSTISAKYNLTFQADRNNNIGDRAFVWRFGGKGYNDGTAQMELTQGGNLRFNSGYGSVATAYGCRAWVNFNGSGTVSIRASGNVSSITDNGTGDYTVNFTNAMPNTNYSVSGSCGRNGSGANANILSVADNTSAPTTSAVRVNTRGDNGTSTDIDLVSVQIFR